MFSTLLFSLLLYIIKMARCSKSLNQISIPVICLKQDSNHSQILKNYPWTWGWDFCQQSRTTCDSVFLFFVPFFSPSSSQLSRLPRLEQSHLLFFGFVKQHYISVWRNSGRDRRYKDKKRANAFCIGGREKKNHEYIIILCKWLIMRLCKTGTKWLVGHLNCLPLYPAHTLTLTPTHSQTFLCKPSHDCQETLNIGWTWVFIIRTT